MPNPNSPQHLYGLSATEVVSRTTSGLVNHAPRPPSRNLPEIFRANVFTPVNAIIGSLFVLILISSPGADSLFAGVIVSNSIIGIIQEIKAKRALDALALLNAPIATVVREGRDLEISVEEVVMDELLRIAPGDQIVVDGEIVDSNGLELDESLLTGESDQLAKSFGDEVLSGSFVASGSGYYRATRIGASSYAAELATEARRFELAHSELRKGIDSILRWLSWIIPPASLALLWSLLGAESSWKLALRGTVAAAVAMVPDGLVLLTSLAMIVGVLRLAKRKALASELASVELLARVDILCLDKTGTLTTGNIVMHSLVVLRGTTAQASSALSALALADPSPNATLRAIAAEFSEPSTWVAAESTPFSSERKWAATRFEAQDTWILGAPEMILKSKASQVMAEVDQQANAGHRVLLLAHAKQPVLDEQLPRDIKPIALVLLDDEIREDAPATLSYLEAQGLQLRVISGDHPQTVAAVARRAGISRAEQGVDARILSSEVAELADQLEENTIFGRVTPHQKQAMVKALQSRGHIVAMTGDGVNDVLALKDADMGIAMGSGSPATRSVAQLVLLENSFSTLPSVLTEGRKVINNIERVANLFVVKATYAVLLTLCIALLGIEFPFLPRHLTLVGTISIGLPGFFLALYPDAERARSGFLERVLRFSIPAGTITTVTTLCAYLILRADTKVSLEQSRTAAVVVLVSVGLVILAQLAMPMTRSKISLVIAMAVFVLVLLNFEASTRYFELDMPPTNTWWILSGIVTIGSIALILGPRLVPGWDEFRQQGS